MRIHADFSLPAIVVPDEHRWVPSPQAGVTRMMLDRVGGECARATSLVRYAPGSIFPRHVHPGGEEILVLSGTFSDDEGEHPAGCYLRHPSGSSHTPSSMQGATIFVKLQQMAPGDTRHVRIDIRDPSNWTSRDGIAMCSLHEHDGETVAMLRLPSGRVLSLGDAAMVEVFVLEGELRRHDARFAVHSWLRLPRGHHDHWSAGDGGLTVYLKTSRLPC